MAEHEIHDETTATASPPGRPSAIIHVGSAVASWAVVVTSTALFVIGLVICVLGAVAGKVLSMAGYGARPSTARTPLTAASPRSASADAAGVAAPDRSTG